MLFGRLVRDNMTEAEWLVCNEPIRMLKFLYGKVRARKKRLLGVSCCRRIWHLLRDERSRSAVELAEQSADWRISARDLDVISGAAEEAFEDAIDSDGNYTPAMAAAHAASYASNPSLRRSDLIEVIQAATEASPFGVLSEHAAQAILFRDIFGSSFHTTKVKRSWLKWNDGIIAKLAQATYNERAFDRLPILADALEEAGCTDAEILNHCRQPGEHVRGCWVVDLILGKS
jgi:hypothetical protein